MKDMRVALTHYVISETTSDNVTALEVTLEMERRVLERGLREIARRFIKMDLQRMVYT